MSGIKESTYLKDVFFFLKKKKPYQNLDSLLLHWGLVIGGIADSHQCVNMEFLQLLTNNKRKLKILGM